MDHYHELETQKYFNQKAKVEINAHKRSNSVKMIKTFILAAIIIGGFSFACIALLQSPEVVQNAVESLQSQGLWPW